MATSKSGRLAHCQKIWQQPEREADDLLRLVAVSAIIVETVLPNVYYPYGLFALLPGELGETAVPQRT